jgi:hypothetical protein
MYVIDKIYKKIKSFIFRLFRSLKGCASAANESVFFCRMVCLGKKLLQS